MVSEIQYSGMLKMYMKESQIGCKVNKSTSNANGYNNNALYTLKRIILVMSMARLENLTILRSWVTWRIAEMKQLWVNI